MSEPSINITAKPSSEFKGSTLVKDPVTGFLMSKEHQEITIAENGQGRVGHGNGPLLVFTPDKKLLFLELLRQHFPNYAKCSKEIGIARQTFVNHYDVDEEFRKCVDEIKQLHVDEVEDIRFKLAKQDKGGLDRMAVLNAYRREIYNPSVKIEIEAKMSPVEAARRVGAVERFIDAEIVQKVKDLKREQSKSE